MAQICAGSIGKRVANWQALQLSRGGRKWNLYFWRVLKVEIKSGQMIEVLFRAEFSLRRMFLSPIAIVTLLFYPAPNDASLRNKHVQPEISRANHPI